MLSHVYMLRAGDTDYYKVGVALDVTSRMKKIQTDNPMKIRLITYSPIEDAYKGEREVHKLLKEYKSSGGKEWFQLEAEQAVDLAGHISEMGLGTDVKEYMALRELVARQNKLEQQFKAIAGQLKLVPTNEELEAFNERQGKKEQLNVDDDPAYQQALDYVKKRGRASTSSIQRALNIGYSRAARLMDRLELDGIIGPQDGARARDLLE